MFETVDKEFIRALIIGGMVFSFIGTFLVLFLAISTALSFSYIPDIMLVLTLCVLFNSIGLGCISEGLWRLLRPK
jgi:hypothetical protein